MKEFIEIPFGAKDSELCGWEYTIPKGYTASIENGKIVVKKEENEDEKIRKVITLIIKGIRANVFEEKGISKEDTIAWLEKQGEQKPAWSEEDERMCNISIRGCKCVIDNFKNSTWDYEDAIAWLKSLKDRMKGE